MNLRNKKCSMCKETKTLDMFSRDTKSRSGFQGSCKPCRNLHAKQYAKTDKCKEARKVRDRNNLTRRKMEKDKWIANNVERYKAALSVRQKRYYVKNIEKLKARITKWKHENRVKRSLIDSTNKHRRLEAGLIDMTAWMAKLEKYNKCLSCLREDVKLTMDHKIPVVKGGTNEIHNLQPLCGKCNSSKGTKIIDYELTSTT